MLEEPIHYGGQYEIEFIPPHPGYHNVYAIFKTKTFDGEIGNDGYFQYVWVYDFIHQGTHVSQIPELIAMLTAIHNNFKDMKDPDEGDEDEGDGPWEIENEEKHDSST